MSQLRRRWLSNSAANLLGGLSAAAFNLALPAIVSRHLPAEQFSSWSLALQIVAYVNLLGLGLQTATARAIAQAEERQDSNSMGKIVRAAHQIARWASGAGLLAVLLLTLAYPLVFPGIPPHLLSDFRGALLLIGISTATQLLALVPMGVFQGLHKNIYFVAAQVGVRLLSVLLIAIGASLAIQLLGLAALLALCSVLLAPLLWHQLRRHLPWLAAASAAQVDPTIRRELLNYCATLSVWSVAMLLVNAVGIVMVGRIAFGMSGAYAIAMTAATVLAGLLGALFSPLMTAAAALHANPAQRGELPTLLLRSTLLCALGLHLLFALTLLIFQPVIRLWVGEAFVASAGPLLLILVGAHALRNLASPYALMLLASGLHRRALWTGLAEGVANLVATIALGLLWGVPGVALGTLVGALVGLLGSLLVNTRNTPELTPAPVGFVIKGFVLPLLLALPVYALILHLRPPG